VLVVRELFARSCTLIATLRTALEHVLGKRTLACAECRARLAAFRTIHAELSGRFMLSFAAGYQFEAMVEAAIAFDLASATNLGTLFHHRISMVVGKRNNRDYYRKGKCSKQG
jgi:hypothetical protein